MACHAPGNGVPWTACRCMSVCARWWSSSADARIEVCAGRGCLGAHRTKSAIKKYRDLKPENIVVGLTAGRLLVKV